jgi:hypothetical protein
MPDKVKETQPILKPLDNNNGLFSFEKLERNVPDKQDKLKEIIAEASKNRVFNNGHVNGE